MIAPTPAPIAARKGSSSTESSRARFAVTREVLPRRQCALILNTAHVRRAKLRRQVRIFRERARTDDRVRRIVVDIEDRSEYDLNA
jgi:hypothetical protein